MWQAHIVQALNEQMNGWMDGWLYTWIRCHLNSIVWLLTIRCCVRCAYVVYFELTRYSTRLPCIVNMIFGAHYFMSAILGS